jgi:hypothetical protein
VGHALACPDPESSLHAVLALSAAHRSNYLVEVIGRFRRDSFVFREPTEERDVTPSSAIGANTTPIGSDSVFVTCQLAGMPRD